MSKQNETKLHSVHLKYNFVAEGEIELDYEPRGWYASARKNIYTENFYHVKLVLIKIVNVANTNS